MTPGGSWVLVPQDRRENGFPGGQENFLDHKTLFDDHIFSCYTYLCEQTFLGVSDMEKQNVTLPLPKMLIRKAKLLAVREDKSLTQLVRDLLEREVERQAGYAKAMSRQRRLLKKGFNLGTKGRITVSREQIHERR